MNNCDSSIVASLVGKFTFYLFRFYIIDVITIAHRCSRVFFSYSSFIVDDLKWTAIYLNVKIKFVFNVESQTTNEY